MYLLLINIKLIIIKQDILKYASYNNNPNVYDSNAQTIQFHFACFTDLCCCLCESVKV